MDAILDAAAKALWEMPSSEMTKEEVGKVNHFLSRWNFGYRHLLTDADLRDLLDIHAKYSRNDS